MRKHERNDRPVLARCAAAAALAAASMLLAGCVDRAAQEQARRTEALIADKTVPVRVAEVTVREIVETVDISGEIIAARDAAIGAKQPGRLVEVYVEDGDAVTAGQPIARQETTEANMRLRQAQAGVTAAQAQLAQAQTDARVGPERTAAGLRAAEARLRQAESQLALVRRGARDEERRQAQAAVDAARSNMETARRNLERMERLEREGAAATADLDQMRNAYQAARSQYESALDTQRMMQAGALPEDLRLAEEAVRQAREGVNDARALQRMDAIHHQRVQGARAGLDSAREQLALARQALDDLTIRAPFPGRISGRPAQVGTMLGGGTPVARLVGAEGVYFEAEVPEREIVRIALGAPVAVTIDALEGRRFHGRIVAVDPMGDAVGRLFRVRVQIDGGLEGLKAGMFARGAVEVRRVPGATVVPSAAVIERDGASVVFVVEGEQARRVAVTPGLSTDGFRQVEGVRTGQRVVVAGAAHLIDGSTVRVEAPRAPGAAGKEEGA
jgi:RND family efflux transporter MFP subunit